MTERISQFRHRITCDFYHSRNFRRIRNDDMSQLTIWLINQNDYGKFAFANLTKDSRNSNERVRYMSRLFSTGRTATWITTHPVYYVLYTGWGLFEHKTQPARKSRRAMCRNWIRHPWPWKIHFSTPGFASNEIYESMCSKLIYVFKFGNNSTLGVLM